MARLFLASKFSNVAKHLKPMLRPTETIVAFVPTAAHPYENQSFVRDDREALAKLGLQILDVDIKGIDHETLARQLEGIDVLFVAGGNVFYLLQEANKCGFGDAVKELLNRGGLYIGSSAGSIIIGPSIEPFKELEYDSAISPDLESFDGHGIIDIIILPHDGKEKYRRENDQAQKECQGRFRTERLKDEEAIVIDGNNSSKIKA